MFIGVYRACIGLYRDCMVYTWALKQFYENPLGPKYILYNYLDSLGLKELQGYVSLRGI